MKFESKKYQVLFDYGYEGMSLEPELYETIDEAVKEAQKYYISFKIVIVVPWEAKQKDE